MSVTFSLVGARYRQVTCPTCGATPGTSLDNGCDTVVEGQRCYGMGFSIPDSPEINMSNTNASAVLIALGVFKDELWGEIDPQYVLNTLAVFDARSLQRATQDNHGVTIDNNGVNNCVRVVSFGVPRDRAEYYVESLRELAQAALAKGVMIIFG